jgi:hypothetical protein
VTRTANTHFTRDIPRPGGTPGCVGYGIDSLVASVAAVCRAKFFGASPESLLAIYPNAVEARRVVAIVHAARLVCDLNFEYLRVGRGAPVTARFGADGICIVDPNRAEHGPAAVFQKVYARPV